MSGGPPRIAPPGVPDTVAIYMDNAAEHLSEFAKEFSLTIKAYADAAPEKPYWFHNLNGTFSGWNVRIQVLTNETDAYEYRGWLATYLRCDDQGWGLLPLSQERISGMSGLLSAAQQAVEQLRITCALRLPRPKAPHPTA